MALNAKGGDMTIVWLILLSVVSACLYRMGGCGPADLQKEWGWVPAPIRKFPKKRDVLANIVTLFAIYLAGAKGPWWAWLLAFGLTWASLSTYWDELFGYDNFYAHGFMIGFSMLPLAFFGDPLSLGIRCVVLAVCMGVWSKLLGNATWEELGRGCFMPLTALLVLFI